MKFRFSFLFFLLAGLAITLSPCASFSQTDEFASGVTAFKAGKLEDAKKIFLKLESEHPGDPTLLLNLGLIAHKEKHDGAALGLWRKALSLHPTNDAILNAIDWLKPKMPKTEIAHEIDSWEEARRLLLLRISPVQTVVVSALFLFFAGWSLLRWWGARRRALEQELAMPPPPIGGVVMSLLAIFLVGISLAIFIDHLDIRGTIVPEKVDVRSAPELAATSLFEAFEGMEVIVLEARKVGDETWRRISYPGGMTGWVRERDVMSFADPSERAFTISGAKP